MTKNEIKAALDLAGVTYAKKANLETLQTLFDGLDVVTQDIVAPIDLQAAGEAIAAEILTLGEFGLGTDDATAVCPHCGINHKDNGWQTPDGYDGATNAFICLGCGGQWGPAVAPKPAPTGTGLKIEKDREEKNGIKRPSIGGKCRAIWDALDAHAESTGDDPTAKDVKALAAEQGWNPNNASIEFYQWRKFHGITKPKA